MKQQHAARVLLAAAPGGRLRGGKIGRRDRWYGLEARDDFPDFKRWWHRQGKDELGGKDLESRKDVDQAYEEWLRQGRPKVK